MIISMISSWMILLINFFIISIFLNLVISTFWRIFPLLLIFSWRMSSISIFQIRPFFLRIPSTFRIFLVFSVFFIRTLFSFRHLILFIFILLFIIFFVNFLQLFFNLLILAFIWRWSFKLNDPTLRIGGILVLLGCVRTFFFFYHVNFIQYFLCSLLLYFILNITNFFFFRNVIFIFHVRKFIMASF